MATHSDVPSSSPAFITQQDPPPNPRAPQHAPPSVVLPVLLPPATLRPLAFRTITKKHSLTLTTAALQALAAFIGRHCGAGWREAGLAEPVLDEIARSWKKAGGGVIVDGGDGKGGALLSSILKTVAGCMAGGRLLQGRRGAPSRQASGNLVVPHGDYGTKQAGDRPAIGREDSLGLSSLALGGAAYDVNGIDDTDDGNPELHPRAWLKVVGAFEQPRITYNTVKQHFERDPVRASALPPASRRARLFHNRYHAIHQRMLRLPAFQRCSARKPPEPTLTPPDTGLAEATHAYKLTSIASLLGRSGGQFFVLGMLVWSASGYLTLSDPTGSVRLDMAKAHPAPDDAGLIFTPGMFVIVNGEYFVPKRSRNRRAALAASTAAASVLENSGGVGGTIAGKFICATVLSPPAEPRHATAHLSSGAPGGELGWLDPLGVGSTRAVGARMRRIEQRVWQRHPLDARNEHGTGRIAFFGDVRLDCHDTLRALDRALHHYEKLAPEHAPLAIVLAGHFAGAHVLADGLGGRSDCIAYKEGFDRLAAILSDLPFLLQNTTFVFVPSEHDALASAAGADAACGMVPRPAVSEFFTGRIQRAFATAHAEAEEEAQLERQKQQQQQQQQRGARGFRRDAQQEPQTTYAGRPVWTTNPARLSLFGPSHEIVLFRDDMMERILRNGMTFPRIGEEEISKMIRRFRRRREREQRRKRRQQRQQQKQQGGQHHPAPGQPTPHYIYSSGADSQGRAAGNNTNSGIAGQEDGVAGYGDPMDLDAPEAPMQEANERGKANASNNTNNNNNNNNNNNHAASAAAADDDVESEEDEDGCTKADFVYNIDNGQDMRSDFIAAAVQAAHAAFRGGDDDDSGDFGIGEDDDEEALDRIDEQLVSAYAKTLLDQAYLSPFPLGLRPVHWDRASSLHLQPLPTALVVFDPDAPACTVRYAGCMVMNPGPLYTREVDEHGRGYGVARWVEWDAQLCDGRLSEMDI